MDYSESISIGGRTYSYTKESIANLCNYILTCLETEFLNSEEKLSFEINYKLKGSNQSLNLKSLKEFNSMVHSKDLIERFRIQITVISIIYMEGAKLSIFLSASSGILNECFVNGSSNTEVDNVSRKIEKYIIENHEKTMKTLDEVMVSLDEVMKDFNNKNKSELNQSKLIKLTENINEVHPVDNNSVVKFQNNNNLETNEKKTWLHMLGYKYQYEIMVIGVVIALISILIAIL